MPFLTTAVIVIILYLFTPSGAAAALRLLGEDDLATVTGRAGVSIDMDLAASVFIGSLKISDTSATPNWLEMKGVNITGPSGGNFLVRTHDDDFINGFHVNPTTIDVSIDPAGRTSLTINDASRLSPRYFDVGQLVFAGQELGSLQVGPVTEGPSILRITAPVAGSGIEFDYTSRLDIGSFRYKYNISDSLALSGVHLVGSASGAPENPASWALTGSYHIGEVVADSPNPAFLKVGALAGDTAPSTFISLPMQGALRVEDVAFGSSSFGPLAIDGINVHRLQLRLTP